MVNAIYPLSADPATNGHVNIAERASRIFDKVLVWIGLNEGKNRTFTLAESEDMTRVSLSYLPNVEVISSEEMLAHYVYDNMIDVVVRGARSAEDFNAERKLYEFLKRQNPDIEVITFFADPKLIGLSSSQIKLEHKSKAFIHELVPLYVKECMDRKLLGYYILGITGETGSGKSYVGKKFVEFGKLLGVQVHNIELDEIGHRITGTLMEPRYVDVRKQIIRTFGKDVALEGKINRKVLGEKVFGDRDALEKLNRIMYQPLTEQLQKELFGKKGLLLLNAALIVESRLAGICNNNILLVDVDKNTQRERLLEKGLNDNQMTRRLSSQYDLAQKKLLLQQYIDAAHYGHIFNINTSGGASDNLIKSTLDDILSRANLG